MTTLNGIVTPEERLALTKERSKAFISDQSHSQRLHLCSRVSSSANRVHFGAWVEVADPQGTLYTYRIVGENKADASKGYISWVSPLARALLDAQVGDLVLGSGQWVRLS